ncbi:MAG: hypothetical protein RMJ17_03890 [Candidatus Aenigmarchaeota archaeon]|nr:hypothetical protein [Candidatus Aenigmarchaeota archaeon]MDW8149702.1 hypothetical protein [Candidatus Aenigmarchaeota archaeon]
MSITNWIGILILVIVILYFLRTETGQYYLDLLKGILGIFNVGKLFSQPTLSNTTVEIYLDSKNSLQSFNIEVKETTLRIATDNLKGIDIKGIGIKTKNKTIHLNISIKRGFVIWKDDGSLKFAGNVYKMNLNDLEFPSDLGFDVNIEAYPDSFYIEKIKAKELVLLNSFGNLSTERGMLKLKGDEVKLRNFEGSISLNSLVKLNGFISRILINNKPADILS